MPLKSSHNDALIHAFEDLVGDIRPELHRYCARMVGSAIDAEDLVQDTLLKAYDYLLTKEHVHNMRGLLFRMVHNRSIDHLKRYARLHAEAIEDTMAINDTEDVLEQKEIARIALKVFMKIPPLPRSCVILKDVIGYRLEEIATLHSMSVSAIKSALHRGRKRLRAYAETDENVLATLDTAHSDLLLRYITLFNERKFEVIREMLAEDVRLDLMNKSIVNGKKRVSGYYARYETLRDWALMPGLVEGRPAILVSNPQLPSNVPQYFMIIGWEGEQIKRIRDYRYTPYVVSSATIASWPSELNGQ